METVYPPEMLNFLQIHYFLFLEHNIYDIFIKHKIIGYLRYIDDILLIYYEELNDINLTLKEFNNIQPNLQFTMEKEENKVNFLDITIKKENNLS
jgi:hypothetical protein